jgi:hypothetical protein
MHEPIGFDFRKWLDKLLPKLIDGAQKIVSSGDQHSPMLLVCGYGGEVMPVGVADFGSIESKDVVAGLQKSLARNVDAVAGVIFISEIWTLISDDRKSVDDYTKGRPAEEGISEHPDRKEAVMFSVIHGSEQIMAICLIDPKTRKLAAPHILDNRAKDSFITGRMAVDKPTEH